MIRIIEKEVLKIKETKSVDPCFIDTAVDFIRIYADKTHHGKEEDILFHRCAMKNMSETDTQLMNELIEEHKFGRKTVGDLVRAKEEYMKTRGSLGVILEKLTTLTDFYPKHIIKEDEIFFPNSEKYFSKDELKSMLEEFWEFDKAIIHENYKLVIEQLEDPKSI